MTSSILDFDFAPFRLTGTVYGTLLNSSEALAALGDSVNHAPYKSAPTAPVLYIKPRNTLAQAGSRIELPATADQLQTGPSLGLVIGRTACRVHKGVALDYVAGYTVVNDFSVPHDSFYRPAVRFKALDSSCSVGPAVVPRDRVSDPDALRVRMYVDGALAQESSTGGMVRSVSRLLADVTDFMTLVPGDVLMLGIPAGAPKVRSGNRVAVEIEGVGRLENLVQGVDA
jgi:5-oxopent-3-ene-1,2,5-tricarboxylate decarboxylase/2-hydroxyhepta-2,4-diene-1,7-dioate isomerase